MTWFLFTGALGRFDRLAKTVNLTMLFASCWDITTCGVAI